MSTILDCLFIFESEAPSRLCVSGRVVSVGRTYWGLKLADSPGGIGLPFVYKE